MRTPLTNLRDADLRRLARRWALPVAAALAAGCQDAVAPAPPPPSAQLATALPPASGGGDGEIIPGRYIVLFTDAVADPAARAREKTSRVGGTLTHTFSHAARGFAARLSAQAVAELRADPDVRAIEPDRVVRLEGESPDALGALATVPWNLDRVDQRDLPLSGSYSPANGGTGVTAYVISTGIRFSHAEFGGRATSGLDVIDGGAADDCNGYGTHVAATVGGQTYGVAKGANLVAVRVIDCSGAGAFSGVIAGIDWVTANHVKPAVALLTTASSATSDALDEAVRRSVAAGVTYVYGAGSGVLDWSTPKDACASSPARVAEGIAVGATEASDAEWISSNYGPCVDLLAPGVYVESAGWQDDAQAETRTGTAMAAAHVAGTAALFLAGHPAATPSQVANAIVENASPNRVALRPASVANGTPNRLLYVGFLGGGTPPANAAPTAAFTSSCAGSTCAFTDASGDADGTLALWSWSFGDATVSSARSPSHAYAAAGSYTVTLTVTDDDGARSTTSSVVVVGAPATPVLQARARKEKGRGYVDLAWTGAIGANVDLFRDGAKLTTTANDGAHTDALSRASGTFTYRVCNAGTTVCSAPSTVGF